MKLKNQELLNEHAIITVTNPHIGPVPEMHSGKVSSLEVLPYLRRTLITFESGMSYSLTPEEVEDEVTIHGYKWPTGLFRGTVAFPHYKHTGLFARMGDQLLCFTYKDTKPKIVPGESIDIFSVALLEVLDENVGNTVFTEDAFDDEILWDLIFPSLRGDR